MCTHTLIHQSTHTPNDENDRLDRFIARVNSLLDLARTLLSFSKLAKAYFALFEFLPFMYECAMVVIHIYHVHTHMLTNESTT